MHTYIILYIIRKNNFRMPYNYILSPPLSAYFLDSCTLNTRDENEMDVKLKKLVKKYPTIYCTYTLPSLPADLAW